MPNRRNFLKFLGAGAAAPLVPDVSKLVLPEVAATAHGVGSTEAVSLAVGPLRDALLGLFRRQSYGSAVRWVHEEVVEVAESNGPRLYHLARFRNESEIEAFLSEKTPLNLARQWYLQHIPEKIFSHRDLPPTIAVLDPRVDAWAAANVPHHRNKLVRSRKLLQVLVDELNNKSWSGRLYLPPGVSYPETWNIGFNPRALIAKIREVRKFNADAHLYTEPPNRTLSDIARDVEDAYYRAISDTIAWKNIREQEVRRGINKEVRKILRWRQSTRNKRWRRSEAALLELTKFRKIVLRAMAEHVAAEEPDWGPHSNIGAEWCLRVLRRIDQHVEVASAKLVVVPHLSEFSAGTLWDLAYAIGKKLGFVYPHYEKYEDKHGFLGKLKLM